jgi:hypothetical protein
MDFHPAGLATGIGSLPFLEADQAVQLILENVPDIPHWPQLPQRGEQEGFVFQFLYPLVNYGLLSISNGRASFDTAHPDWANRLTRFYSVYLEVEAGDSLALEEFAFPPDAAAGFYAFLEEVSKKGPASALYFKGQLAGPLTVAFQLEDEKGRLAYYDEQLRDLVVKSLALHARWQAGKLAALGRPAIIFVDEPAISAYGKSSFITVTREMIQSDLDTIFQAIHKTGALAGAHSCDAIDWSILFESDLEIVNLDIYGYGNSLLPYVRELKIFLQRGGVMAWGIVPTHEKVWEEDENSLLAKLYELWQELEKRGIEREILQQQSLITPACGTGLLTPGLARRIYHLNKAVSEKIRMSDWSFPATDV